ncbi:MAG: DnaJ domain-containing protein [Myxococcota bacterium]|nr:DnaJ domain-containing protein [Myxococcota bacterium]
MRAVDLSQQTLAELWLNLALERASGALRLECGRFRKSLVFLDGDLVGAESNLEGESLSERLVAAGELTMLEARRVAEAVADRQHPEAAALVGLKLIQPQRLLSAMRERLCTCALEALSWQSGTVRFEAHARPASEARPLRCDALDLLHRGIRLHHTAEQLAGRLNDAGSLYATLRESRKVTLHKWIGDAAIALRVLRSLDGNRTFSDTIGAAAENRRALAALWIAQRAGYLEFADRPLLEDGYVRKAGEHPFPVIEIEVIDPSPTRPNLRPTTAPMSSATPDTSECEEIRKAVTALHESLGSSNHYEMLNVPRDAGDAAIRTAYFKAAKRFHPDKLASLGRDEIRDTAAEVFAALAEANEILSDALQRKQYDERLANGGTAAGIDVARLAQSEGFFRKAEVLAKMGDFRGAAELLESAVQIWPEESEYHAALGFARFKKSPTDLEGARASLDVAIDLRPTNPQAHMWLSLVLGASGDITGSERHAATARRLDSDVS